MKIVVFGWNEMTAFSNVIDRYVLEVDTPPVVDTYGLCEWNCYVPEYIREGAYFTTYAAARAEAVRVLQRQHADLEQAIKEVQERRQKDTKTVK